jgi:hypothetical protein
LYVGGYFFTSQGDPGNNIAIWNGTSWSQPASGAMPSNVGNMLVFQNELYIVGQINDVSGIPVTGIAKWDGINWHSLGANFDINPTCLSSLGNDLFLGGGFHVIDGDTMNHVTRYSPPLAIEENVGESKDITIIVNPSNGNISFTSLFYPIQTIHLFDLSGKVVFTSEKIFENFYQCKLNSVNGIYITEVIMNGNIYRSKIAMIH